MIYTDKEIKDDVCPKCKGVGWFAEHDPNDGTEEHMTYGQCTTCPIQVPCENCEGKGLLQANR